MTRWASGSIHVVTNVARLRIGIPSSTSSSSMSRMASAAGMPCSRQPVVGRGLEEEAVAELRAEGVELLDDGLAAVPRPRRLGRALLDRHGRTSSETSGVGRQEAPPSRGGAHHPVRMNGAAPVQPGERPAPRRRARPAAGAAPACRRRRAAAGRGSGSRASTAPRRRPATPPSMAVMWPPSCASVVIASTSGSCVDRKKASDTRSRRSSTRAVEHERRHAADDQEEHEEQQHLRDAPRRSRRAPPRRAACR